MAYFSRDNLRRWSRHSTKPFEIGLGNILHRVKTVSISNQHYHLLLQKSVSKLFYPKLYYNYIHCWCRASPNYISMPDWHVRAARAVNGKASKCNGWRLGQKWLGRDESLSPSERCTAVRSGVLVRESHVWCLNYLLVYQFSGLVSSWQHQPRNY